MANQTWRIERRNDGAIIVRVPSRRQNDRGLPDAVFSFRAGDPQYRKWDQRLRDLEASRARSTPAGSGSAPAGSG